MNYLDLIWDDPTSLIPLKGLEGKANVNLSNLVEEGEEKIKTIAGGGSTPTVIDLSEFDISSRLTPENPIDVTSAIPLGYKPKIGDIIILESEENELMCCSGMSQMGTGYMSLWGIQGADVLYMANTEEGTWMLFSRL